MPSRRGIGRGELVLVLAAEMLELDARRVGRLNVIFERVRVPGNITLEPAEPVEGDGQRGDAEHHARDLAHGGQMAAQGRPRRGPLGQDRQYEERQGEPKGIEERDQEGAAAYAMVVRGHRDGGEHRAGAGDEDGTKAQAEEKPATLSRIARRAQPGERSLEQLAHSGDHQPDRDGAEQSHPQPEEEVLREVEEAEQGGGEEHRQAEAQDESTDDEEGPGAAGARGSPGHDDREDRDDARRESGDQPAQEGNDDKFTHGRWIPSVAWPRVSSNCSL